MAFGKWQISLKFKRDSCCSQLGEGNSHRLLGPYLEGFSELPAVPQAGALTRMKCSPGRNGVRGHTSFCAQI